MSNLIREPALQAAIQALKLPIGSCGLDLGCGIGLHTPLLAAAVGPTGHVTGIDISKDFLDQARETAQKQGLSERISFQTGDIKELPFKNKTFDWLWCVDTLWAGPASAGGVIQNPVPIVKELARVVKPAGTVALLFWSGQKLLPGYPLLEARLNTAAPAYAPFQEGIDPKLHCLRALSWLQEAGLENPVVETFVADVHAPLTEQMRQALTEIFAMFWQKARADVAPHDWDRFQRLCQPKSADFILNAPDYYAFVTYSMFKGRVGS